MLQEYGFLPFLQKFDGFDSAVTITFSWTFDGSQANIGSLEFAVTEESISHAIGLPIVGKKYFKKGKLKRKLWCQFVVNLEKKVDWKNDLQWNTMIGKWKDLLYVLQKFLTCEGLYSLTLLYHIRLLLHFESRKLINFPYYFLIILENMMKGVQKGKSNQAAYKLYHHRLIIILVERELEPRSVTWEEFLKQFWE